MEQSIGVGSDAGCRQRHQRTHRRRWALKRDLVEQTAINVGMEYRSIFDQVGGFAVYINHLLSSFYLEFGIHDHRDGGTHLDILDVGAKAGGGNRKVIGVER